MASYGDGLGRLPELRDAEDAEAEAVKLLGVLEGIILTADDPLSTEDGRLFRAIDEARALVCVVRMRH